MTFHKPLEELNFTLRHAEQMAVKTTLYAKEWPRLPAVLTSATLFDTWMQDLERMGQTLVQVNGVIPKIIARMKRSVQEIGDTPLFIEAERIEFIHRLFDDFKELHGHVVDALSVLGHESIDTDKTVNILVRFASISYNKVHQVKELKQVIEASETLSQRMREVPRMMSTIQSMDSRSAF